MIQFRKIAAYERTSPQGEDLFAYLDRLTIQKIDPPSLHPHELKTDAQRILTSPLRRAIEYISPHDQSRVRVLHQLRELPLSLRELCTRQEWQHARSRIVRQRFKEAFIADRLPLSRRMIEQEIRYVLAELQPWHTTFVLSHSFRLKLIEAYIETQGDIFRYPYLIHEWINDARKTYNWGEGFDVSWETYDRIRQSIKDGL